MKAPFGGSGYGADAGGDLLLALIERSLLSLRGMIGLLDAEHTALRNGDVASVKHLSQEKAAGLMSLSSLLAQLRQRPWPAHIPANELLDLLGRCQERNRANGVLMNMQAARRQAGHASLGLASDGYGRNGNTPLRAESRTLASC
jgi:flagellar biosynthesis/type III secretory pathway chaperone